MAEIDSPVDYYLRVFSNFEFGPGGIFAINHSVAFIGAITGIFVISLSFLVFRAGNEDNLKNRAIGILLFTEGISAFLLAFFWIYPFSLESLRVITWFRALGGVLGFTRMFIMVFFPLFFIETNWAKKGRQIFQWKFVWILPTVSFMIIAFPILSVGLSGSFGDMAYVCYTTHDKFNYKGTQNDDIAVLTSVLQRVDGSWKVVHGQRSTGRKPEEGLPQFA